MARRLCQFLLTLAVLYGLALGAFSLLHYGGARPDVVTTAGDFHAWVAALLKGGTKPTPDPGGLPVPKEAPPPPSVSPPIEPPAVPLDERGKALFRVRTEILPKAMAEVKELETRGIKDLAGAKAKARATIVEARDLLGPLLDARPDDPEVQTLYKKVMELLIAVDKR